MQQARAKARDYTHSLSRQRLSHDPEPNTIKRAGIDNHQVLVLIKRETHEAETRHYEFRFLGIAKPEDAPPSTVRGDRVKNALDVECKTLWTAEPGEESDDFTTRRYAIDRIETGSCRACYVK